MGMFSWKCKGCGDELCCPEYVRIEGEKGAYDGYGRAGAFDWGVFLDASGYERGRKMPCPVAWHELCFQQATPKQQRCEEPSDHAPNQGFGEAQDKSMPSPDTPHPHAKHGWKLTDKFKVKLFDIE